MTSPDAKLPDDDTRDVETLTTSDRLRVTLEIAIAALILTAIYYIFAPEEDIDLPRESSSCQGQRYKDQDRRQNGKEYFRSSHSFSIPPMDGFSARGRPRCAGRLRAIMRASV